jgi:two-component system response regulator HydG
MDGYLLLGKLSGTTKWLENKWTRGPHDRDGAAAGCSFAREDRIGLFRAAAGGTLFLDEIGNVPLHLQSKLLTALERREVVPVGADKPEPIDVRLISATNLTPEHLADADRFRQDLFYRINTVEITLPPLRERREDIPLLLEHFIAFYAQKYNFPVKRLSATALDELMAHAWPGNVRALRHAVERAVILSEGAILEADDFSLVAERTNASAQGSHDTSRLDDIEAALPLACDFRARFKAC